MKCEDDAYNSKKVAGNLMDTTGEMIEKHGVQENGVHCFASIGMVQYHANF